MWAMLRRMIKSLPNIVSEADFCRAVLPKAPSQSSQHALIRMIFFRSENVYLVGHAVHVDINDGGCVVTTGRSESTTGNVGMAGEAMAQVAIVKIGYRARAGQGGAFPAHATGNKLIRL